jgi:ABC-type lipoprotein release transport system permease subunit
LPYAVLAGDVYVITQGSGPASINEDLAAALRAQSWADAVSPEILAFGTIRDQPVLVRAVDPDVFFEIERASLLQSEPVADRWAYAGAGLAARAGLALGDEVPLIGSSSPRLAIARIAGIFSADTAADDELLVDFSMGHFLTGSAFDSYYTIRVRTSGPRALLAFLEGDDVSVHVYGPGIVRADVNSDPPSDERLTNLVLRYGSGALAQDLITTALSEGTNSVRVVALGLGAFLALLVAFGIHAAQARTFADYRKAVGTLRALGAGGWYLRGRMVLETVPLAIAAGAAGALLGGVLAVVLRPTASVPVFGHEIRAAFEPITFLLVLAAVVLASVGSASLLLRRALRERPVESIREEPLAETPHSLEVVLRG